MRRAWCQMCLALLLGPLVVAIAPAKPASAAVGCWEATCAGKNHIEMGCDTDKTQIGGVSPKTPTTGTKMDIYLWYSNACHAVWGYFWTDDGFATAYAYALYSQAIYGGKEQEQQLTLYANNATYSTMVPWTQSTKACLQRVPGKDPEPDSQYDPEYRYNCTKWY